MDRQVELNSETMGDGLRVTVDTELCTGHARCVSLAPMLFESDEYGNAHEIGDGEVSPEWVDAARRAEANCPEYAISVIE